MTAQFLAWVTRWVMSPMADAGNTEGGGLLGKGEAMMGSFWTMLVSRCLWEIWVHAGVWSLKILVRPGGECDLGLTSL